MYDILYVHPQDIRLRQECRNSLSLNLLFPREKRDENLIADVVIKYSIFN